MNFGNMFDSEYNDGIEVNLKDKGSSNKDRYHKHKDIILECGLRPSDAFFEIDDGKVKPG
ncbi:MAG: hypothetical protein GX077_01470 [Tissierellia bacterium]|nr:hypothetical protein [Tissierellia bacterium]